MVPQNHIHPDVRKIVREHAYGIEEFKAWNEGGAVLKCEEFGFSGSRSLNKIGYETGGIFHWGDCVKIFIEPYQL